MNCMHQERSFFFLLFLILDPELDWIVLDRYRGLCGFGRLHTFTGFMYSALARLWNLHACPFKRNRCFSFLFFLGGGLLSKSNGFNFVDKVVPPTVTIAANILKEGRK